MEEAVAAVVVVVVEGVVVLDAVVDAAEEDQPREVPVPPQVDLLSKPQEVVDAALVAEVVVPGLEVLLVLVPVLVLVLLELLNRGKQNSCFEGKTTTTIKGLLCMAYKLIDPASSSCAANIC